MKKKITDISKYNHNPKEFYNSLVEEIENYIKIYSEPIKDENLTRIIPDKKLTKEEKTIAKEIGKAITKLCKKYKNGHMGATEITTLTGDILYSQYNPNNLYKILNRSIYDFLEKASEFDFYLEKTKDIR